MRVTNSLDEFVCNSCRTVRTINEYETYETGYGDIIYRFWCRSCGIYNDWRYYRVNGKFEFR